MKRMMTIAAIAMLAACGPRQVEVRTAPPQATGLAIQVTNNLTQAVNVYITNAGTDTFLRQVPASTMLTVPVQGMSPGSTVTVKAVSVDGVHTYSRPNVVLNGTYLLSVP